MQHAPRLTQALHTLASLLLVILLLTITSKALGQSDRKSLASPTPEHRHEKRLRESFCRIEKRLAQSFSGELPGDAFASSRGRVAPTLPALTWPTRGNIELPDLLISDTLPTLDTEAMICDRPTPAPSLSLWPTYDTPSITTPEQAWARVDTQPVTLSFTSTPRPHTLTAGYRWARHGEPADRLTLDDASVNDLAQVTDTLNELSRYTHWETIDGNPDDWRLSFQLTFAY